MKPWRIEDGVLICQPWSFSRPDARYPHRNYVLATCTIDRVTFSVLTNRTGSHCWLMAYGHGFAGHRSKRINTVSTSSEFISQLWCNALCGGKVRIE